MNKPYSLAVVIGRFQPLHYGHVALFEEAEAIADRILVLVGSSFIAPNIKNPLSFEERFEIIDQALDDITGNDYSIRGITDNLYNDQQWAASVQAAVEDYLAEFDLKKPKVVLVGHTKDASSYYLKMFPSYAYLEVDATGNLDATEIREHLYDRLPLEEIRSEVPMSTYHYLMGWKLTEDFENRVAEFEHIREYKHQFASLPYPPIFVTCDSVVINSGHILLVKRRSHPGKGLWALPGGFLNANERIVDGIIRELEEETRIKVHHEELKVSLKGTHVFDAPNRSLRGRTITHAGLIVLNKKELPSVRGSDDAERAKWFPISEFYEMSDKMFEDHYSIGTYMINRAG